MILLFTKSESGKEKSEKLNISLQIQIKCRNRNISSQNLVKVLSLYLLATYTFCQRNHLKVTKFELQVCW